MEGGLRTGLAKHKASVVNAAEWKQLVKHNEIDSWGKDQGLMNGSWGSQARSKIRNCSFS